MDDEKLAINIIAFFSGIALVCEEIDKETPKKD